MTRNALTEKIVATRISRGLVWKGIAGQMGRSKEWTTDAPPYRFYELVQVYGTTPAVRARNL